MKDIAITEHGPRIRSLLEKGAWHTSFIALSMLFFLCMISSLMLVAVLSNFALSYHNRYLLIEILGNESMSETNKYTTTTVMTTLTTDNETNSTTETATTDFDLPMSTSDLPKKRNPIIILQEVNTHRQSYQCRLVCNDPSIYIARINVTLSAKGANFLCLEIEVPTTDIKVAKRKVAYETLKYLHPEYLNSSMTDNEWDYGLPNCENATESEEIWKEKCK